MDGSTIRTWIAIGLMFAFSSASVAAADDPSVASRLGRLHAAVQTMQQHLDAMAKLAEGARAAKDVIRENYLTDKLKAMRGLVKACQDAERSFAAAAAAGNVNVMNHEEEKVSIAASKGESLFVLAQSAIGLANTYVGASAVEVLIHGVPPSTSGSTETYNSLPAGLLTPPVVDAVVLVRPPAASPYF